MKPTELLKAMADDTRLRILVMLTEEELCVSELEKILRLAQSNVSRHLAKLQAARLVTCRRAAQHVYYRLNRELSDTWPAIHLLLLNLKNHPDYEVDFGALDAHREAGQTVDYLHKNQSAFSVDDLI